MTTKNPKEKGICIVGLGYVGAVTGVCFADLGNDVIFVEIDEKKIKAINSGRSPIFEPGMDELIKKNKEKIFSTQNLKEAFLQSNIFFAITDISFTLFFSKASKNVASSHCLVE